MRPSARSPTPPTQPARAAWEQRAGWAGSYRELVEHDDPVDALGAAPARGLAEKHAAFHAAHRALGLPDVGAEEEDMSEGKLRALWAAWQRELNTAPRYVADELDATHDALRRAREDATVWAARADAENDPLVRDELATAAAQARERAEQLADQVEQLEYADHARTVFLTETAVTRDRAERARVAAGWKGVDLTDTSDRVTADEWLDAHQHEQAVAEADRPITETRPRPTVDRRDHDRGDARPGPRRRRRPRPTTPGRRADRGGAGAGPARHLTPRPDRDDRPRGAAPRPTRRRHRRRGRPRRSSCSPTSRPAAPPSRPPPRTPPNSKPRTTNSAPNSPARAALDDTAADGTRHARRARPVRRSTTTTARSWTEPDEPIARALSRGLREVHQHRLRGRR